MLNVITIVVWYTNLKTACLLGRIPACRWSFIGMLAGASNPAINNQLMNMKSFSEYFPAIV
jgi:hypothetical protein